MFLSQAESRIQPNFFGWFLADFRLIDGKTLSMYPYTKKSTVFKFLEVRTQNIFWVLTFKNLKTVDFLVYGYIIERFSINQPKADQKSAES